MKRAGFCAGVSYRVDAFSSGEAGPCGLGRRRPGALAAAPLNAGQFNHTALLNDLPAARVGLGLRWC